MSEVWFLTHQFILSGDIEIEGALTPKTFFFLLPLPRVLTPTAHYLQSKRSHRCTFLTLRKMQVFEARCCTDSYNIYTFTKEPHVTAHPQHGSPSVRSVLLFKKTHKGCSTYWHCETHRIRMEVCLFPPEPSGNLADVWTDNKLVLFPRWRDFTSTELRGQRERLKLQTVRKKVDKNYRPSNFTSWGRDRS